MKKTGRKREAYRGDWPQVGHGTAGGTDWGVASFAEEDLQPQFTKEKRRKEG